MHQRGTAPETAPPLGPISLHSVLQIPLVVEPPLHLLLLQGVAPSRHVQQVQPGAEVHGVRGPQRRPLGGLRESLKVVPEAQPSPSLAPRFAGRVASERESGVVFVVVVGGLTCWSGVLSR